MGVKHMGREPSMHLETIGGLEPLIEAKRGDAENFSERRLGFLRHAVLQSAFKLLQDRILTVAAGANDEGNAELLAVGLVQAVKLGKFRLG